MKISRISAASPMLAAVAALLAAGLMPAPTSQGGNGFAGSWEEFWPGIEDHATHVVSFSNNQYTVKGWSPMTSSYEVTDVRLDGDTLKFNEKTTAIVVEYELRVRDANTLLGRAKGMRGWQDGILWRRIGAGAVAAAAVSETSAPAASGGVPSIADTVWSGTDSDGDFYEFTFRKGGQLRFTTNTSGSTLTYEDEGDIWAQNGNIVVICTSHYATRQGTITGNQMKGAAWNFAGRRWDWTVEKKK